MILTVACEYVLEWNESVLVKSISKKFATQHLKLRSKYCRDLLSKSYPESARPQDLNNCKSTFNLTLE